MAPSTLDREEEALTSTVAERKFVISVRYELMRRTGGRGEACLDVFALTREVL